MTIVVDVLTLGQIQVVYRKVKCACKSPGVMLDVKRESYGILAFLRDSLILTGFIDFYEIH